MSLTESQSRAVHVLGRPLFIQAGAGTGKTFTLKKRLGYGLGQESGPAIPGIENLLTITFTNKAADELKSRLESMLGESARDIWACTFHSACVRILRRDAERLGYTGAFTIYDTSDSLSLLKHIVKDMDLDENLALKEQLLDQCSRLHFQLGSEILDGDSLGKGYYLDLLFRFSSSIILCCSLCCLLVFQTVKLISSVLLEFAPGWFSALAFTL